MGEGESVTTESLGRNVLAHGHDRMEETVAVVPFPHHEGRRQNQTWFRRMSVSRSGPACSCKVIPKLSTWAASCRGFPRTESILML